MKHLSLPLLMVMMLRQGTHLNLRRFLLFQRLRRVSIIKKLEGTLIIDGQNYLMENSVDGNVMTIIPATGSTGNIKYEFQN